MSTEQKRKNKPRPKTIDLGNLITSYDSGLTAVAELAGVSPEEMQLGEVNSILKSAKAGIATAVGVSIDKVKVKVSLAA